MADPAYRCLCGSEQGLVVWEGLAHGLTVPLERTICACSRCGLGQLWPPVTEEQVATLTPVCEGHDLHRPRQRRSLVEYPMDATKTILRQWVSAELPPGSRVLDVGCGGGRLVMELAQRGYKVTGLEPSPVAGVAEAAAAVGGLILPTTLEEYDPGAEMFSGIIFSHVLEHLPRPDLALAAAARLLEPGGRVFVEVPHLERPVTSLGRCVPVAHQWYFTPEAMRYYLLQAGLKPSAERVFRFASFQTLATRHPAGPVTPPANDGGAQRSLARLQRHRWLYYARLQFLWRKIPYLRRAIFFGLPQVKRY
jgi:2-polyprenyl-3-methyl-5-hydroxy-6-metoxy-1,4-benzoquinol methylase